jgi:hypothetical protein
MLAGSNALTAYERCLQEILDMQSELDPKAAAIPLGNPVELNYLQSARGRPMSRGHASAPIGHYPEGMYGIFAELKVYLVEESDAKGPPATFVGRIERHLEREVEGLTTNDFLSKIQGVLQQAGMKRVIMMNKNDVVTYAYDQENPKDWAEVFSAALKEGGSSKGLDEWWVLVSGWNEEFKFRQDITFKEKHTFAAPSMTLEIRAFPA